MAFFCCDKVELRIVSITEARIVAELSFKYHKSVKLLELSTNEYESGMNSIYTIEGIQKLLQPESEILYKYLPNLPKDLLSYPRDKFVMVSYNAFHQSDMIVYKVEMDVSIVNIINSPEPNKVERVRRFIKLITLLNIQKCSRAAMYFYDNILPILRRENCRDSALVVNLANLFSFYMWIMKRNNPLILKFVLYHAQKVHSSLNLSLLTDYSTDPVSACFLSHKIQNVLILLRFGAPSASPRTFTIEQLLRRDEIFLYRRCRRIISNQRRAFFLFQLWYDFRHHRNSPEGLRYIWKCINDPYLSITEIDATILPAFLEQPTTALVNYYQNNIIGQACSPNPSPRTLKAICRVEVRRLLNFNHQLPFGIYDLHIVKSLELYLNLFT